MRLSQPRLDRSVIGAESAEPGRRWQGRNALRPNETARHPLGVTRRRWGVSFHRAGRRFEGRESATSDLQGL
jgi:hypothetical protein